MTLKNRSRSGPLAADLYPAAAVSNPNYKDVVAFMILIIMLLVRPRGLFGAAWSTRRLMEG